MKGKVYKISCKTDPNLVYVGSTTQSLRKRLIKHRYDCKKLLKSIMFYQHVNNDWSNWEIELIEEIEFEDKKELYEREGHYIKSIGTLNTQIPLRDDKQYYEDNRESILKYQHQYRQNNKNKIKEYQEEYYQQNIHKKKEYDRQYLKYRHDVRKANNHYRHNLLKKSFNAFKNHRTDLVVDGDI